MSNSNDEEDLESREDVDPGEPLALLAELQEEPARGFFGRIRNRIERRRLGSHVIELAWQATVVVFLELVDLLFQLFKGDQGQKGEGG